MYIILWEFRVRAGQEAGFELAYGPNGSWAALFSAAADYLGTELLRSAEGSGRYVTVDRWRSRAGYEAFRAAHADAYEALDRACETLTAAEAVLGEFESLP